ncbi:hypothetical protein [Metabacillus litoralis]|uniref:hypothetical protein n=1 Tax=Metabacillus litoralis TaxID=152268 RepID=UPI001CFF0799|nr:hypothetical protein [Metabacillus litoralis]
MKTYKAFGLIIFSDVLLSELVEVHSQKADVSIKIGKVPDTFDGIVFDQGNKKISVDTFRLDNVGIAKYYVNNGDLIIVEPYENSLFEEVKLFLLGSCMGAILHQRKILPLHGSCIHVDGQAILLTGNSGAGKSTIASAFLNKGYKMITDDVAAIVMDELNSPMVYPSYPSQKLWEDAIERLGRNDRKKSLNRISNDLDKYSVESREQFFDKSTRLEFVIELLPSDAKRVEVQKITGPEKLNIILKNTYRMFMVAATNNVELHFLQCVNVANKVEVYRVVRPRDECLENEICEGLLEIILKGGEGNEY